MVTIKLLKHEAVFHIRSTTIIIKDEFSQNSWCLSMRYKYILYGNRNQIIKISSCTIYHSKGHLVSSKAPSEENYKLPYCKYNIAGQFNPISYVHLKGP